MKNCLSFSEKFKYLMLYSCITSIQEYVTSCGIQLLHITPNATFTLNDFDDQEQNLMFVNIGVGDGGAGRGNLLHPLERNSGKSENIWALNFW